MQVFLLVSVIRKDVRVWTGEQFKCESPICQSCLKTNSLHSVGGDAAETKGVPLGHDRSLVRGVTTTSKKSGTRQTRKMYTSRANRKSMHNLTANYSY